MVKFRDANYCNLKLILIWLVIFAHWIEPRIWHDPGLMNLYRWIYLIHMPLFSFLSGLFITGTRDCFRSLKRVLPTYCLFQGTAAALGTAPWHTPWWYLWYLLSLSCWLLLGAVLFRWVRVKWIVLILSVAAGCLCGRVEWVGRSWSVSRTVVFFPYFWLGVLMKPGFPWHRLRWIGLLCFGALFLAKPRMGVVDLYHAGPCAPALRLQCYGYALLLGIFVLSWCPRRQFPWTRAGADTMPAYLVHGPVVGLMRRVLVNHVWLWTTLFLYIIHLAMRWHGLYGITGREAKPWPDLNTSTAPKENRSTDFSCP